MHRDSIKRYSVFSSFKKCFNKQFRASKLYVTHKGISVFTVPCIKHLDNHLTCIGEHAYNYQELMARVACRAKVFLEIQYNILASISLYTVAQLYTGRLSVHKPVQIYRATHNNHLHTSNRLTERGIGDRWYPTENVHCTKASIFRL